MKINVRMTENGDSFPVQMRDLPEAIPVIFRNVQPISVADNDYRVLSNKPSINSVTLVGDLTSADLGITASFPSGGEVGDILTKTSSADDGVSWITPASDFSGDNTRPMTASGVLEQIGNINVLLAAI